VKDYIAKYNLEDELSNAVNHAIKLDSDDPFRVISDYLKKLAKNSGDGSDEEDDDDDIIPEGEEPVPIVRGRREQVMAAALEVPSDWKPPIYEKDEASQKFLKETMASNKLMKSLAPSDREALMLAFKKEDFAAGTKIISQGDKSDNMNFYILNSGACDIDVAGKGVVMTAKKGVAFGELALLHNAPRAATVTANDGEPVTAWALDAISFKMILMGKSQKDLSAYEDFLKGIDLLKGLSDEAKREMAASLKEIEFPAEANIICENEDGNMFYVIRDGEVKCTKAAEAEEVCRRLTRGDFFGELALLSSDKRKATVTAVQPTTVLSLKREEFERLLGPLKDKILETSNANQSER